MSSTPPGQSVVIVGAGPTGLALACELAAAGVSCTVLERRRAPSAESRAMGLYSRTMELLDLRGHASALAALGRPAGRIRLGTGGTIDFTALDSRFPYLNVLPQGRTEEQLQAHALDLGVVIERDAEVYGLTQDDSGVTLQVRTPTAEWEESAAFVVGCDGAHSVVRELAGIAFRGRTYDMAPILADVRLRKPPPEDVLLLPRPGSVLMSVPYGDGLFRLGVAHRDHPWTREPVTLDELREMLRQALGFDPEPYEPQWLARFKIHQRIADQYRAGRVLIAGDAAHLHSPLGGQGINLGIQDAVNLGWKLAAEVQGWAPSGLLDSYERERRPHAQQILRMTDRATRSATSTSRWVSTLRGAVLPKVLSRGPLQRIATEAVAGLRTSYAGAAAPTRLPVGAGRRLPDLEVPVQEAPPVRLYELMRDSRFLLLDLAPDGVAAAAADRWGARVATLRSAGPVPALTGVTTLLVRPDGHIAWADGTTDPGARSARTREALLRWCGAPSPAATDGPADLRVAVPVAPATPVATTTAVDELIAGSGN